MNIDVQNTHPFPLLCVKYNMTYPLSTLNLYPVLTPLLCRPYTNNPQWHSRLTHPDHMTGQLFSNRPYVVLFLTPLV